MPESRPLLFTALNGAALFAMGFAMSQRGSSFNDLILISNTDVKGGSFFVLAGNFGFTLGSLCAGFLYERFQSRTLLVAMGMMVAGGFFALIPWCTALWAMIAVNGLASLFTGAAETLCSALVIAAWDGESESAMQFLNFCFSVGAILSPLITEPFMAPKAADDMTNVTSIPIYSYLNTTSTSGTTRISVLPSSGNSNLASGMNCSRLINVSDVIQLNVTDCDDSHYSRRMKSSDMKSNLYYAFIITSILFAVVSLLFFVAYMKSQSKNQKRKPKEEEVSSTIIRKLPRNVHVGLAGLSVAFYYFHTMVVDSFGHYLFYFVVTHLHWNKQNGAVAVSILYTAGTCMKLFLILCSRWVSMGRIVLVSTVGMVVSLSLFTIAGKFQVDVLIWLAVSAMALSDASVFGGGFSWIDGNLLKVNGKMTSALDVASGLGAMSAPVPLGFLMKEWSLMAFSYFVGGHSCISAGLFFVMYFVVRPITDRKFGPLRIARNNTTVLDDDASDDMLRNSTHRQSNVSRESCSDVDASKDVHI